MAAPVAQLAALLRRVTDADLRDLAGGPGYSRGMAYAAQNRVTNLKVTSTMSLSATVHGQGAAYHSEAYLHSIPPVTPVVIDGVCSCPIGGDCKHVVALLAVARRTLGLAGANGAAAAPALWERLLGDVLSTPNETLFTPTALLIEVRSPLTGRYGGGSGAPKLAVRPLVPGKTGWIKTGISWNGLDQVSYGRVQVDPRQKDALRRLLPLDGGRYRYYQYPEWLELDGLDPGWLEALHRCRAAGVELLTDQRHPGRVVLAENPACVTVDLTRDPDGAVRLTPSVALPAEFDTIGPDDAPPTWVGIGAPPHGVWAQVGADLYLAALDPAPDMATYRLLQHGQVVVPAPDVPRFLASTAPALAKRLRLGSGDGTVELAEVSPPGLRLRVTHLPGLQLGLEWHYAYTVGAQELIVAVGAIDHRETRDVQAEAALMAAVVPAFGPLPGLLHRTPAGTIEPYPRSTLVRFDVVRFLDEVLPAVQEVPGVRVEVHGDPVVYTEVVEAPSVRLSLTESSDEHDWFDLSVEVRVAGELVPMADLVRAMTLGEPQVILPTGSWFRIDRPELAELQRLIDEARALQDDPRGPLRLSPYHADLWAELEGLGVVEAQSARWAALVKGLTGVTEPVAPPSDLRATLRPYQQEGYEWLTFLRRHGLGGILADDMGLGKTLQTLAMILRAREDEKEREDAAEQAGDGAPWLVVAPTSVLGAWAGEAERFAPGLRVVVLRETYARRGVSVAELARGADLVVTSYAVFRIDEEAFGEVAWAGLVLDEAQFVKNHQAVTYQCVRKLSAPVKFAITGTPMENNLMELWSLLSIVAPGLFPHPKPFTEHFRRPIESGSAPERLETLRRRIRPVMLRRTKQLVAADLPPKQEQVLRVDLPPKHRRIYDQRLARERQRVLGLLDDPQRNRIAIFRALTLLRQLSLHPGLVEAEHSTVACAKLDTLLEMLEPVLAEGHRALVFSQFTSFLAMARARLDAAGISYAYLDGRTRKRAEAIAEFTAGDAPVFLISLKAGGTGLTLTEADYVFLLDPWWNPAVEAQAVDRTHRIGQDKPVNVYRLVSADTIEDKVVALQERKRALFATVVDEGALASGSLTSEDIRALL